MIHSNGAPPSLRVMANQCLAAGLCVVPSNAHKSPALSSWTEYQSILPHADEVDEWFCHPRRQPYGMGLICGKISDGLEVQDLDIKHDPTRQLNELAEKAIKEYAPGLWEKLVIESTPSGGRHLLYRCKEPERNQDLAFCPDATGELKAIAETRGEGGFIVTSPTQGYVLLQGSLTETPFLEDEEREALFAAIRSLDRSPAPTVAPAVHTEARTNFPSIGVKPGDDYNTRGDWKSLLLRHGWTEKDEKHFRRPGKADGVSATWDTLSKAPRCLHVFSPNAPPLKKGGTYSPFALYTELECGGDYRKSTKELAALGYGEQRLKSAAHHKLNGTTEVYDPGYEEPQSNERITDIPAESKVKPFTLWAPSQFIAYVPDPSACLLGTGYLELGQWTSFVGIGGLGKTRLALWLFICQMLKMKWCGIETGGVPQKAVILSTENGLKRWKDDLTKILSTLTPEQRAVVEANLRILAMTDDEDGDICLADLSNVARLKATLVMANPGMVAFDPFADMMDGDENKTVDLMATITLLRSITRTCCPKAAILIIHHARTGSANVAQAGDNFNAGNFGRGAKALFSKVRCEIQLAPEDRDNTDRLVLACGKSNDSAKFAPRCVVFNPTDFTYSVDPSFDIDAWRDDVSGVRKKSSVSIADVVNAVHEKCPMQGDEISSRDIFSEFEDSGVTKRTLQRHVSSAIESGYLKNGKKPYMLRLGGKPLPKN